LGVPGGAIHIHKNEEDLGHQEEEGGSGGHPEVLHPARDRVDQEAREVKEELHPEPGPSPVLRVGFQDAKQEGESHQDDEGQGRVASDPVQEGTVVTAVVVGEHDTQGDQYHRDGETKKAALGSEDGEEEGESHGDGDGIVHADSDADSDADANANADTDADADANSDPNKFTEHDGDRYGDRDTDRDANGDPYPDRDANTNYH
jgi:hypothetical protein